LCLTSAACKCRHIDGQVPENGTAYPTEEGVSAEAGASSHREVGCAIQPVERIQREDLDGVTSPEKGLVGVGHRLSQGVNEKWYTVSAERQRTSADEHVYDKGVGKDPLLFNFRKGAKSVIDIYRYIYRYIYI
jgi:hypothetical protein